MNQKLIAENQPLNFVTDINFFTPGVLRTKSWQILHDEGVTFDQKKWFEGNNKLLALENNVSEMDTINKLCIFLLSNLV